VVVRAAVARTAAPRRSPRSSAFEAAKGTVDNARPRA